MNRDFAVLNGIYGDILNHEDREGHEVLIADPPSRKASAGQVFTAFGAGVSILYFILRSDLLPVFLLQ